MANIPAPNQALPIVPPVLNIHAYRAVTERCNQIKHGTKLLTMYTRLQKGYSPELKMVTLVEKIELMLLFVGQMLQYAIEDAISNPDDPTTPPMTDAMRKLIETTEKDLETITEKVVMDLSETVNQLCNGDSMVNRINQKLDDVLFHPDMAPGKVAMNNAAKNFGDKAETQIAP